VDWTRLEELRKRIGTERLVLDLSCRRREGRYWVVTDRWQHWTDLDVCAETLNAMSKHCSEFLIHAADVEGRVGGVEEPLVERLGAWAGIPITYAGGIRNLDDIRMIETAGGGQLDFTVGSALDVFGGAGVRYEDMVSLNQTGRLPNDGGECTAHPETTVNEEADTDRPPASCEPHGPRKAQNPGTRRNTRTHHP
jgi:phosphoribosylformimino-5-aminoimidazole carboxamide ribotide isomerase